MITFPFRHFRLAAAMGGAVAIGLVAGCAAHAPASSAMQLAPKHHVALQAAYKPLASLVGKSCENDFNSNGHAVFNEVTFVPQPDGTVSAELITSSRNGATGMGHLHKLVPSKDGAFAYRSDAHYVHTVYPDGKGGMKEMIDQGIYAEPQPYVCGPAGQPVQATVPQKGQKEASK